MTKLLYVSQNPVFTSFLLLIVRGITTRRFVGHTKDVLSVAFSADNRQIVSGSRDKTIKLWNTLGVCKYTITVYMYFSLISLFFARHYISGKQLSNSDVIGSEKNMGSMVHFIIALILSISGRFPL